MDLKLTFTWNGSFHNFMSISPNIHLPKNSRNGRYCTIFTWSLINDAPFAPPPLSLNLHWSWLCNLISHTMGNQEQPIFCFILVLAHIPFLVLPPFYTYFSFLHSLVVVSLLYFSTICKRINAYVVCTVAYTAACACLLYVLHYFRRPFAGYFLPFFSFPWIDEQLSREYRRSIHICMYRESVPQLN